MSENVAKRSYPEYDEILANPGGGGLALLGISLVLFSLVSSELLPLAPRVFGLLLLVLGSLQLVAGAWELRRRNGFGATACFGYGFFWLSLIALFIHPQLRHGQAPNASMFACYLIMWAFFTGVLFLGTLRLSRTLRLAYVLLAVFLLGFAAGLAMHLRELQLAAGYLGSLCGALFLVLAGVKLFAARRAPAPIVAAGRKPV